ncbi:FkbM family methyltransferase [Mycobacterium malmoense]|uniref:FkbM family methyltransferase n=1 Tax=Mycobacterium malmoense TaxID=1780 RepID=UPI0011473E9E|nr:FkbM family methyltransferase [Mycobacterium malmoense]
MDPKGKATTFRPRLRQLARDLLYRSILYRMIRSLFGNRPVMRDVQGVRLAMPWSHRLPDYARVYPNYGQNLVALALRLGEIDQPLGVVDIGANIGDSAAQILAKVDARVLCVEADPEYLPYLQRNLGSDHRCVIEFGLLVADTADASGLGAVRKGGTTRFAQNGAGGAAGTLVVAQLPDRHPELPPIRLVKSDTDGYDTTLIPPLAHAYAAFHPVLFFEYDPDLTRKAGKPEPVSMWADLMAAGYTDVGIWDNFGNPIQLLPIEDVPARTAVLDKPFVERGYHYWDVAVVHANDEVGKKALDRLFGPARTRDGEIGRPWKFS